MAVHAAAPSLTATSVERRPVRHLHRVIGPVELDFAEKDHPLLTSRTMPIHVCSNEQRMSIMV
eukprot:1069308-Amphidinium_carterae.1